jgi:peptide subunit release factor 1 (eRF1)
MPTGRNEGERTMGGSNRDAFAATIDDHLRRFYQEVAAQLRQIVADQGIRRIILGGPGEAAHALKHEMHPALARQVVAIVPIPQWVDDRAVMRLALPAALEVEHQQEVALVDEVIDLARSGSRGALGLVAVEDCLARQQVELLILPWPLADPALRDRLPLAALAAGAKIEFVSGAAAERVIAEGGVAARLFYTLRPEFGEPALP